MGKNCHHCIAILATALEKIQWRILMISIYYGHYRRCLEQKKAPLPLFEDCAFASTIFLIAFGHSKSIFLWFARFNQISRKPIRFLKPYRFGRRFGSISPAMFCTSMRPHSPGLMPTHFQDGLWQQRYFF